MKTIESIGKTVEEAVQKGLEQLDLSIAEAQIDILDEGTKGVLGLLGCKDGPRACQRKIFTGKQSSIFFIKCSKIYESV